MLFLRLEIVCHIRGDGHDLAAFKDPSEVEALRHLSPLYGAGLPDFRIFRFAA